MPSTHQTPPRPASTLVTVGSALLSAIALGACSSADVRPDVTVVTDPSFDSMITLYVARDDAYTADLTWKNLPPYRVQVDGRYVAYDAAQYIHADSTGAVSFTLPAGRHVVALVDDEGRTAVTSPPVETKAGGDPTQLYLSPAVVFFGGQTTMRTRVIVDEPGAVPAGSVHVRVMNAFADHQPLQVVQCPTAVEGGHVYFAGECAPVGAPIAYGDLYEADETLDGLGKLGFHWAGPDAASPVVAAVNPGNATVASGSIIRIPLQVGGPHSTCPTCVLTEF